MDMQVLVGEPVRIPGVSVSPHPFQGAKGRELCGEVLAYAAEELERPIQVAQLPHEKELGQVGEALVAEARRAGQPGG